MSNSSSEVQTNFGDFFNKFISTLHRVLVWTVLLILFYLVKHKFLFVNNVVSATWVAANHLFIFNYYSLKKYIYKIHNTQLVRNGLKWPEGGLHILDVTQYHCFVTPLSGLAELVSFTPLRGTLDSLFIVVSA